MISKFTILVLSIMLFVGMTAFAVDTTIADCRARATLIASHPDLNDWQQRHVCPKLVALYKEPGDAVE